MALLILRFQSPLSMHTLATFIFHVQLKALVFKIDLDSIWIPERIMYLPLISMAQFILTKFIVIIHFTQIFIMALNLAAIYPLPMIFPF